jgi:hypothetical protein
VAGISVDAIVYGLELGEQDLTFSPDFGCGVPLLKRLSSGLFAMNRVGCHVCSRL